MSRFYMETTRISPEQTVAEIQKVLGLYGANAIRVDYEDGEVVAVSFMIRIDKIEIPFKLPCRYESIFKILQQDRKRHRLENEEEDTLKAKRIAWRQILKWIEAQMALVETQMASMDEVFMPYMQVKGGETLYETFKGSGYAAIEWKKK